LADLPEWRVCDAYRYEGPPDDLDGYFAHAGGSIRAIIPRRPADLERQERLTARLMRCRPIHRTVERRDDDRRADDRAVACARLEAWLGAPVAIASSGPTAVDKVGHGGRAAGVGFRRIVSAGARPGRV
jgi:hypothetical protein